MIEDRLESWHGMPTGRNWTCPECGNERPVTKWCSTISEERDSRQCPYCCTWFDYQLDIELLIGAQAPGLFEWLNRRINSDFGLGACVGTALAFGVFILVITLVF